MGVTPGRGGGVTGRLRATLAVLLLAVGATILPAVPAVAAESDTLYALLNQARWDNGQAGLIRNAAMDQVAANWAAQMAANGAMSHNPNYSSQIPGGWTRAGENVAKGYPTASAMHAAWMGSPGHRANILGNYTDVGVAFLSSGGTTWGVQVFAAYPGHVGPPNPSAPAPAPAPAPAEDPPPAPAPAPPSTGSAPTGPAPTAPIPPIPWRAPRHRFRRPSPNPSQPLSHRPRPRRRETSHAPPPLPRRPAHPLHRLEPSRRSASQRSLAPPSRSRPVSSSGAPAAQHPDGSG